MSGSSSNPPGSLKLLIHSAKDLDSLVSVGNQEPYYVIECGQQRSRSKNATGDGRNPVWSTAHKFELTFEAHCKVVIKDDVTKGIIGEAVVDLSQVRATGRDDRTLPLTTLGGRQRGQLKIKMKFQPHEGGSLARSGSARSDPDAAAARPPAAQSAVAAPPVESPKRVLRRQQTSFAREASYANTSAVRPVPPATVPEEVEDGSNPFIASQQQPQQQQQRGTPPQSPGGAVRYDNPSMHPPRAPPAPGSRGAAAGGGDSFGSSGSLPPRSPALGGAGSSAEQSMEREGAQLSTMHSARSKSPERDTDAASDVSYRAAERNLRKLDSRASLAKQALQQLKEELAEIAEVRGGAGAGALGGRKQPPPTSRTVTPTTPEAPQELAALLQSPSDLGGTSRGADGSAGVSPMAYGYQQQQQQQQQHSPSGTPPAFGRSQSGAYRGTASAAAAVAMAHAMGSATAGGANEPLVEELIQMYTKMDAELADHKAVFSEQGAAISSLRAALEAAQADKAALESELTALKQLTASTAQQHFMEVKKLKDSNAALSQQGPAGLQQAGPQLAPLHHGMSGRFANGTADNAQQYRAHIEQLEQDLAAAQLQRQDAEEELQLLQHTHAELLEELQRARRAAAAPKPSPEAERKLAGYDSLAMELRQAQAALQDAQQAAQHAQQAQQASQAELAQLREAHADVSKQVAQATDRSQQVAAQLAAATAELATTRAALAEAEQARTALQQLEQRTRTEIGALQAQLQAAESARAQLQSSSDARVGALQKELDSASGALDHLKGKSDEMEYLQQQLRRAWQKNIELQNKVQALEGKEGEGSPAAAAAAAAAAAKGENDTLRHDQLDRENNFLMKELAASKLELAQLKEREVVYQRTLFKVKGNNNRSSRAGAASEIIAA